MNTLLNVLCYKQIRSIYLSVIMTIFNPNLNDHLAIQELAEPLPTSGFSMYMPHYRICHGLLVNSLEPQYIIIQSPSECLANMTL